MSNNKLTVLSPNIKHLNKLQVLHLSNNQLTTLPTDEIGELKELGRLLVADNPLTLEETRKVVKLQNKMKLDISGKDIKCCYLYLCYAL